jgi:hypothetical protein
MAYIQFTIPSSEHNPLRKLRRMQILGAMEAWSKIYDIKFEKDIVGYEINYHFANPQDLSFFLLNPPELPRKYSVIS